MKSLDAQVASLETETEKMSRALDAQKAAATEMESTLRKKVDESSKDSQRKVRSLVSTFTDWLILCRQQKLNN